MAHSNSFIDGAIDGTIKLIQRDDANVSEAKQLLSAANVAAVGHGRDNPSAVAVAIADRLAALSIDGISAARVQRDIAYKASRVYGVLGQRPSRSADYAAGHAAIVTADEAAKPPVSKAEAAKPPVSKAEAAKAAKLAKAEAAKAAKA